MSLALRCLAHKRPEVPVGGEWAPRTRYNHYRVLTQICKLHHFFLGHVAEVFSECRSVGVPREARTIQQDKLKWPVRSCGGNRWSLPPERRERRVRQHADKK